MGKGKLVLYLMLIVVFSLPFISAQSEEFKIYSKTDLNVCSCSSIVNTVIIENTANIANSYSISTNNPYVILSQNTFVLKPRTKIAIKEKITIPKKIRKGNGKKITIQGAKANNLKNIEVNIPLGQLVSITGVSGSGKSTLILDILSKSLAKKFYRAKAEPGLHKSIKGLSASGIISIFSDCEPLSIIVVPDLALAICASQTDVTINPAATKAVILFRKVAGPLPPNTVCEAPPNTAPISAPLPACRRITRIRKEHST